MEPTELDRHVLRQLTRLRSMTALLGAIVSTMCGVLYNREEFSPEQLREADHSTMQTILALQQELASAQDEAVNFMVQEGLIVPQ